MNITLLKGNLARDPELRVVNTSGKQTSVVNFTVAVSREYTKNNGEKDKITSFINCEAACVKSLTPITPARAPPPKRPPKFISNLPGYRRKCLIKASSYTLHRLHLLAA